MIPSTIEEMATLIYLMEINEWGVDSNEKLCAKLANESFTAAKAFYDVVQKRQEQDQEQWTGHFASQRWKDLERNASESLPRPKALRKSKSQRGNGTDEGTPKPMTESKGSYVPTPTQVSPPQPTPDK